MTASRYIMPAALGGVLLALLALERLSPLRRRRRGTMRRIGVNAAVSALCILTGALLVRPTAEFVMGWSGRGGIGLLRLVAMPTWIEWAAAFVLMDLSFYGWHRLNHEVQVLWRFHSVHHADPDMDATTSFRFHFGEIAYSSAFRALQVAVIGMSLEAYVLYEAVSQGCTLFHHSNLRLPLGLECVLNLVIVTPRMHGVHHSNIVAETNSNYSVVFRWWDVLGQSLRLNVPQCDVIIGASGYDAPQDNTLWRLMVMPVSRHRKDRRGLKARDGVTGKRTTMVE